MGVSDEGLGVGDLLERLAQAPLDVVGELRATHSRQLSEPCALGFDQEHGIFEDDESVNRFLVMAINYFRHHGARQEGELSAGVVLEDDAEVLGEGTFVLAVELA